MMFLSFIPSLLNMLIKYKRIIFPVLVGLAVVLLVSGALMKAKASGHKQATDECNAGKLETINESLRIKEKHENVPRVSDADYINRLLKGL